VVNVNWACTAAGSAGSNSASSLAAQAVLRQLAVLFEQLVVVKEF